jgi:hypothetical protein
MPYLCHVNLLTLIMFSKSNKKETMTNTNRDFKQAEKILTETINIAPSTGEILVSYALMYSNLTDQGKKQAQEQLRLIGVNYDKMQNIVKFKTYLKTKNKGGK